jgi:hypothetical protein
MDVVNSRTLQDMSIMLLGAQCLLRLLEREGAKDDLIMLPIKAADDNCKAFDFSIGATVQMSDDSKKMQREAQRVILVAKDIVANSGSDADSD